MKRFRRWLFNGVAAVSLFLLVIIVVLWAISYQNGIVIFTRGRVSLNSSHGELYLDENQNPPGWMFPVPNNATNTWTFIYKFKTLFGAPHWLAGGITTILPIVWIAQDVHNRRRLRRIRRGLCVACGYNLRASPDRCPECGTIPPKKEIVSK
jgi:hypothetical protein